MRNHFATSLPKIIVIVSLFLMTSTAHASGGPMDPVPQLVNLAILFTLLFLAYQKVIRPMLVERAAAIKNDLEKGQKELSIAQAHFEEVEKEYQQLDAKVSEIHAKADADIEEMKEFFAQQRVDEEKRIEISTKRAIQDELARAKRELQDESTEIALSIAEELVKKSITTEDQARFKATFVRAVEKEGTNV